MFYIYTGNHDEYDRGKVPDPGCAARGGDDPVN